MSPLFELQSGWARRCFVQTLLMLKRVWFYEIIIAIVLFVIYCAVAQLPKAIQCVGHVVAFAVTYLRTVLYAADDKANLDLVNIKKILTSLTFKEILASAIWFMVFNVVLTIAFNNAAVLANSNLMAVFSWPNLTKDEIFLDAAQLLIFQTSTAICFINIYHACRFLLSLDKIDTLKLYLDIHWGILFGIACRAVFRKTLLLSAVIGHLILMGMTFVNVLFSSLFIPFFYILAPCFLFCFARELFTGRTSSREPEPHHVNNLVPSVV